MVQSHVDAAGGQAIQCSTIIVRVTEHQVKDEEEDWK